MWVRGSFDAFAWFGGSGGTIVLLIAILVFSKRADYLTVAKLSIGPGIFNINEPVMFGLPIVLNAIMFIPFIIAPLVATTIGWLATYWGLVSPVSQQVTGCAANVIIILSNRCRLACANRHFSMYGGHLLHLGTICYLSK